jgi:hypothetical protein
METAKFLKESRQRVIREKKEALTKQLLFAQATRAFALQQQVKLLNYLSENPAVAPPSTVANVMGEIREEVDYTVAHYALRQGYRADDLSEAMQSDFYDRQYVEHPELVDAIVVRAQRAIERKQHVQIEI